MENLYITNYTPHLGILIAFLTVFPIVLNIFVVKDRKWNKKQNIFKFVLNIFKYILLLVIVGILCINKDLMNIANANFIMGVMMFFYILYYELYIKFLISGRKEENYYRPYLKIKIPMQICMSMGIIFASIWSKNILLMIFSIIFGILHIYTSYVYFIENYKKNEKNNKIENIK